MMKDYYLRGMYETCIHAEECNKTTHGMNNDICQGCNMYYQKLPIKIADPGGQSGEKENIMKKYYIDYNTGAGNEEFEGTLEEAKARADKGAAYTQQSIDIYGLDDTGNKADLVATRIWYGVRFDPSECEDGEDADVIEFGDFGHYAPWEEN